MSKDEGPTQAEMDLQSVKWELSEKKTPGYVKAERTSDEEWKIRDLLWEIKELQKKVRDERFDTLWFIVNSQHERWDEGESVDWRSVRIASESMVKILTKVHFDERFERAARPPPPPPRKD